MQRDGREQQQAVRLGEAIRLHSAALGKIVVVRTDQLELLQETLEDEREQKGMALCCGSRATAAGCKGG